MYKRNIFEGIVLEGIYANLVDIWVDELNRVFGLVNFMSDSNNIVKAGLVLGAILLGAGIIEALSKKECPVCKRKIDKNAKQCPYCGARLEWKEDKGDRE